MLKQLTTEGNCEGSNDGDEGHGHEKGDYDDNEVRLKARLNGSNRCWSVTLSNIVRCLDH